ncbi:hypothetical protein ACFOJ6_24220 [Gordonia humi]|uniref:hypothetical protein n=1 Tax=Gordonia humi TaxID=686429 RepID=UPI0036105FFB
MAVSGGDGVVVETGAVDHERAPAEDGRELGAEFVGERRAEGTEREGTVEVLIASARGVRGAREVSDLHSARS